MSNNKPIQVFEHDKLRYDEHSEFQKHHFEAMVKFNENNNNKYFTIIHKGILFNSYVGVIQIGGLTIEILPKADNSNNKTLWRDVLLNMLRVCKKIQIDNVSETQLKKRYNSILEAYFELYLSEIEYLIKRGLIKKYGKKRENQLALKGKLLFSQNIQYNVVHKERFYCEHQVYDKDHLLHKILQEGLKVIDNLTGHNLKDRIKRLQFSFDDITPMTITQSDFKKIKLTRKSNAYHKAIDIAKMLILNYSPNINSGNENMLTLLFDMNKLWEEYIFRILHKHKPTNYNVSFQNSDIFWENKKIRPDIVISSETAVFVIDTKWKIINNISQPDDADLKQMFVYNLHWESSKSMLLYPQTNQRDTQFGNYKYKHSNQSLNQCKLGFVSVLKNGRIKESRLLSEEIFEKLQVY